MLSWAGPCLVSVLGQQLTLGSMSVELPPPLPYWNQRSVAVCGIGAVAVSGKYWWKPNLSVVIVADMDIEFPLSSACYSRMFRLINSALIKLACLLTKIVELRVSVR